MDMIRTIHAWFLGTRLGQEQGITAATAPAFMAQFRELASRLDATRKQSAA